MYLLCFLACSYVVVRFFLLLLCFSSPVAFQWPVHCLVGLVGPGLADLRRQTGTDPPRMTGNPEEPFFEAAGDKTASRGTKTLKNHYVFHQTCLTRATFEENPCVKTQKTKKNSKTIMIYVKNCQTRSFLMRILV